jgi:hypothetical protein
MRYNSCLAEEVSYGQRASILVSGEAPWLGLGTAPYVGRMGRKHSLVMRPCRCSSVAYNSSAGLKADGTNPIRALLSATDIFD